MKTFLTNLVQRIVPKRERVVTLSQVYKTFTWQTITKEQIEELGTEAIYWNAIAAVIQLRPELYSNKLERNMKQTHTADRYMTMIDHYIELAHLKNKPILEVHQGIQAWLHQQPYHEKTAVVTSEALSTDNNVGKRLVNELPYFASHELLKHEKLIKYACAWIPRIVVGSGLFASIMAIQGIILLGVPRPPNELLFGGMFLAILISACIGYAIVCEGVSMMEDLVEFKLRRSREIAAHKQAFDEMTLDWEQIENACYDTQSDMWHWLHLSQIQFTLTMSPFLSLLQNQLVYNKKLKRYEFDVAAVCTRPADFSKLTPKEAFVLICANGLKNVIYTTNAKKRLVNKAPCLQDAPESAMPCNTNLPLIGALTERQP